ncbi:hypothetical protein PFISCL1PPCAC_27309, partial [Pristionchus fissidentatus]
FIVVSVSAAGNIRTMSQSDASHRYGSAPRDPNATMSENDNTTIAGLNMTACRLTQQREMCSAVSGSHSLICTFILATFFDIS